MGPSSKPCETPGDEQRDERKVVSFVDSLSFVPPVHRSGLTLPKPSRMVKSSAPVVHFVVPMMERISSKALLARVERFMVFILDGKFFMRSLSSSGGGGGKLEVGAMSRSVREGLLYSPKRSARRNLSRSVNVFGQFAR